MTPEQYLELLDIILNGMVKRGLGLDKETARILTTLLGFAFEEGQILTEKEAKELREYAGEQIEKYGIQENTLFYKQIIEEPAEEAETERIRKEQEEEEARKQAVAIAKQKQLLPLGGRGTGAEQIWTAENTIRDLQLQLDVAPDYLKPTIQGQIQELRGFQTEQKGIENLQLRQTAEAQERAEGWQGLDDIDDQLLQGGLFEINPFGGLKLKGEGAFAEHGSRAYELERNRIIRERQTPTFAPPSFKEAGITGTRRFQDLFESYYPSIAREFMAKPVEERQPDSWAEYLKKKTREAEVEWAELTPSQRGERPAAFQPPIKTISPF